MINVLLIGDVISQIGCEFLRKKLPNLKKDFEIDLTIANGENSAVGNGILPSSANHLFDSGVDVITTGNHVYQRREIYQYFEETPQIIRPANFSDECVGNGYYIYDMGKYTICVINLMGTSYMEPLNNPFNIIDKILSSVKATYYIVDFHAEATGEKKAMGFYLDGRVSCIVGTHTHVQTADEEILPNGTAYITDLGMTGPRHSVLGVNPQNVISKLKTNMPTRFEVATGECMLNALLVKIDTKTSKCAEVFRINIT